MEKTTYSRKYLHTTNLRMCLDALVCCTDVRTIKLFERFCNWDLCTYLLLISKKELPVTICQLQMLHITESALKLAKFFLNTYDKFPAFDFTLVSKMQFLIAESFFGWGQIVWDTVQCKAMQSTQGWRNI